MSLRLGKKPHIPDERDLLFSSYVTKTQLPRIPRAFGHEKLFPAKGWGMLGNDEYGDCAWAGPAHEHMLLNKAAGRDVRFTTANVLSDYAACTGFDPHDPSSDQGTDMRQSAKYRQKVGIVDSNGRRHKIGAYVWLRPGDFTQLLQALYLFGAVGIGVEFPDSAMDQFNAGKKTWTVVSGARIEGGHYICAVGRHSTTRVVTWGQCIGMSRPFYETYCDEAIVYVSEDQLTDSGLSPEGFRNDQLLADLRAL